MAPSDDSSPLTQALQGLVSPETLEFLHKTALHPHSPVQVFKRHSAIYLQKAFSISYVFAAPYINAALGLLTDQPEIVSLAVFLVLLASAWIVLGWIRRLMAFATRLVFGALFWGFVGLMIMFVVQNGVWETARQAVVVGGKMAGFAAVVKDVWVGELRRYEQEGRGHSRR